MIQKTLYIILAVWVFSLLWTANYWLLLSQSWLDLVRMQFIFSQLVWYFNYSYYLIDIFLNADVLIIFLRVIAWWYLFIFQSRIVLFILNIFK